MTDSIYREVFDIREGESADFEVAFSAFIAALIFGFSSTHPFYIGLKILAAILIGITLIRKMAVSSQYSDGQRVAEYTMPLVSLISYLSLVYLIGLAVPLIQTYIPFSIDPLILFGVLAFLIVEILVLFQELVTRDLLLWSASRVHEKIEVHRGDRLGFYLVKFRDRILNASMANDLPPIFQEIELDDLAPDGPRFIQTPKFILGVIILPAAGIYGILWLLEAVVGSTVVALFGLVGAMSIQFIVNFWYNRYGLVNHQSVRWRTATWFISVVAAYYLII